MVMAATASSLRGSRAAFSATAPRCREPRTSESRKKSEGTSHLDIQVLVFYLLAFTGMSNEAFSICGKEVAESLMRDAILEPKYLMISW